MSEEKDIEVQGEYQLVIQNDHYTGNRYAVPIVANFEAISKWLDGELEKYRKLVFTEDKIDEAKNTRAKLNRLATQLDNERKRIKNECMQYYNEIDPKFKALQAQIDSPKGMIDGQLEMFEQNRIDAKFAECFKVYNEVFTPEIAEVIPYHEISNKQWLNKGYTLANVRQDITDMFKQIQTGIASVKALNSKHELALLKTFYDTRDMARVLEDKARLDMLDKRAEEQARAAAERKAQIERDMAAKLNKPLPVITQQSTVNEVLEAVMQEAAIPNPERTFTETFRVTTTKAKFLALKAFFDANNIKPERVIENGK